MSNDWIKWPGGDCPVAKGTLVDVKYRDGVEAMGVTAGTEWGEDGHTSVNNRCALEWGNFDSMFDWDIVAYRLAQPAHVTRLLTERDELKERADKLRDFIESDTYLGLAVEDQLLLHEQHDAMTEYLAVLDKRIARHG
jgi:hypothetical protein